MASEDVIELGSSDEEPEPAPKKASASKRRPNAMVQIPSSITMKHAKPVHHNINPIRKLIGKGLTVTKVKSRKDQNGKPQQVKPVRMPQMHNVKPMALGGIPVQRHNFPIVATSLVNPLNVVKNNLGMASLQKPSLVNLPIQIQKAKSVNRLPSSLTVTKMPGSTGLGIKVFGSPVPKATGATKRPAAPKISNMKKKQKINNEQHVLTVNLDDEELPTTSTSSPQWYLRPEDTAASAVIKDEEEPSIEEQNNSEPKRFVEITIEDSPIKPNNKRTHEVGSELAITIEDSPIKVTSKAPTSAGSDNENSEQSPKEKQSKKKLDYPKEDGILQNVECTTIEIELEPIDTGTENDVTGLTCDQVNSVETVKEKIKEDVHIDNIIEIVESPAKTVQTPPSTPKKVDSLSRRMKPTLIKAQCSQSSEFHPLYQEFIDLCLQIENSNDMKTIVEKKIKNYYRQVPKEYTESEEFLELVQSKLLSMKAGPEKLYLYIKDIVDELNLQRKMAKAKPTIQETREIEAEKFQYGEESDFDQKRQRQIRKLEKTLKKLHRAIQKLEEQEVDFDDDEDSVYLLTERYKERMVRVHKKFCQLTNTKMPSEPRIQLQARPGQPSGPVKRLEKWVNKKVPIGTPLPFPDFHDVLKCVRDANNEDKLGWNEADIVEEARDLFIRCGKKLQRRRQENEWRLAASRISAEVDPAENSEELKNKLDSNKQVAAIKETEVFNKYADKQSQMNLEAIEISDNEAEESPVESEDEEPQDENSILENKEKRKKRLRRLLHEKSKKDEDKEEKSDDKKKSKDKENSASGDDDKIVKAIGGADKEETKETEVDLILEEVNEDRMEVDSISQNLSEENRNSDERVHSISGDSKVDSDVDELHLLQKLHSDEVNTSAADTTDSDSPVDISDTLTSSDSKKPANSDVISIENSSYSEAESKDAYTNADEEKKVAEKRDEREIVVPERLSGEIEYSSVGIQLNKTNNEEYNESVESILLATTDEEVDDREKDDNPKSNDECVNLKDDAISISETTIENNCENESSTLTNKDTGSVSLKAGTKTKDNYSSEVIERNSVAAASDSLGGVEPEVEKDATNNQELIENIHSIESVDFDKPQEITETSLPIKDTRQLKENDNSCSEAVDKNPVIESDHSQLGDNQHKILLTDELLSDNPSVETLESDDSQEAVKNNEQTQKTNKQIVEVSDTTLESDNTLESAKKGEYVIVGNEQQSKTETPSEEIFVSHNAQESEAKECKKTPDPTEETLEQNKLRDSNSPDQAFGFSQKGRVNDESKKFEENKHDLDYSSVPDNVNSNSLDCILDDLRSEIEIESEIESSLRKDDFSTTAN